MKFLPLQPDMRIPPPDGLELARQVRASRVNASTVIVMISGEQDRTLMRRAFEAEVEIFLFKPIERKKLLRLIRGAEGPIERERWRFTRVRMSCRVSMEAGNDRRAGTTLDLSVSGALVQSRHTFPLGTLVTVSLEVEAGKTPLRSGARVVRIVGTDCMGISLRTSGPRKAFVGKSSCCRYSRSRLMNENPSLDCVGVTAYSQVILPVWLARHFAAVLRSGPEVPLADVD